MVVLAVTWMANAGEETEVTNIFRELEKASRQEPGCLMYVVHRHRTDPPVASLPKVCGQRT